MQHARKAVRRSVCGAALMLLIMTAFSGVSAAVLDTSTSESQRLSSSLSGADTIVVGTIRATPYDQFASLEKSTAENLPDKYETVPLHYVVLVDKVIKGDKSLESKQIKVHSRDAAAYVATSKGLHWTTVNYSYSSDYMDPGINAFGIFILHHNKLLEFQCVEGTRPMLQIAEFTAGFSTASPNPIEQVNFQLIEFLTKPIPPKALQRQENGVYVGFDQGLREAAKALKFVQFESVKKQLQSAAQDSNLEPLQSLLALEVLFSANDFSKEDRVKELLLRPTRASDLSFNMYGNWSPVVDNSAYVEKLPAIHKWLLTHPEVIDSICLSLKSPDLKVRRQAACVLSELGTAQVKGPLAQFGLNDRDRTVQFFSCVGIAKATGIGEVFNGNFQTNEDQYVQYYKDLAAVIDDSHSPLVVPRLDDAQPNFKYTGDFSSLSRTPNMQFVLPSAEIILAGHLVPTTKRGLDPQKYRRIEVEQILKNFNGGSLQDVNVFIGCGASCESGIYFLKPLDDGTYSTPGGLYLNALQKPPTELQRSISPSGTPSQKVIESMLSILTTRHADLRPSPSLESSSLGTAVVASINPQAGKTTSFTPKRHAVKLDCSLQDGMRGQAAAALSELPPTEVYKVLQEVQKQNLDLDSEIWLANAALSVGDYEALKSVKPLLVGKAPLEQPVDFAIHILAEKMISGVGMDYSPKIPLTEVVGLLTDLMHSERVEIRRGAASTLAHLGRGENPPHLVIEPLANVGLYDADMDVRFYAIEGLERFAYLQIHDHCTREDFEIDQAKYIERMRLWAKMREKNPLSENASRSTNSESNEARKWNIEAFQQMSVGFAIEVQILLALFGLTQIIVGICGVTSKIPFTNISITSRKHLLLGIVLIALAMLVPFL